MCVVFPYQEILPTRPTSPSFPFSCTTVVAMQGTPTSSTRNTNTTDTIDQDTLDDLATKLNSDKITYHHKSQQEFMFFMTKLKSHIRSKGTDKMKKVFIDRQTDVDGEIEIFDLIVPMIKQANIFNTLTITYNDKGMKFLKYLENHWTTNGANKETEQKRLIKQYKDLIATPLDKYTVTVGQITKLGNDSFLIRDLLRKTDQ